jgi:hypothetical protein
MTRTIIAVIAGYSIWSVLWLAGGALIQTLDPEAYLEGQPIESLPILLASLALSILCSLCAGAAASRLDRPQATRTLGWMAGALILTGIGVQVSAWALMPVWYHLSFLALLLPASLLGGRLGR